MSDRDDVNAFTTKRTESTPDNSRYAAHPLTDDSHDRNCRFESNVFHFFMSQVLPKLPAQSLNRTLGDPQWNNEADVVLRRRLRNQQNIGSDGRGRRECAAQDIPHSHDPWAA